DWRSVRVGSNAVMLSVLASAVQKLPLWSTATPTRLENPPCGAVLPLIVARKLPLVSNFRATLVPASPTYTSPVDGPPELSTAMLVGRENWPGPQPALPAWQGVVHTSPFPVPSVTPHPQAAMKLPLASNFSTRALPLSATYTAPLA